VTPIEFLLKVHMQVGPLSTFKDRFMRSLNIHVGKEMVRYLTMAPRPSVAEFREFLFRELTNEELNSQGAIGPGSRLDARPTDPSHIDQRRSLRGSSETGEVDPRGKGSE
jgi:hypothetical protein